MKKSLKFHKNKTGFTLVELVIVIAIVIVLSVISVPIYRGYVDKAKMAEGYALLGAILSAQKAYYSEHGNFLSGHHGSAGLELYTANETVLGIDARGNKYFTNFWCGWCGDGDAPAYIRESFLASLILPKELRTDTYNMLSLHYTINGQTEFSFRKSKNNLD